MGVQMNERHSTNFWPIMRALFMAITVAIIIQMIVGCTTTPSTTTPNVETDFKGAWNNPAWDSILMASIDSTGLSAVTDIKDAPDYCPKYKSLTVGQRRAFWATMLIAISKRESNYKPETVFQENFKDAKDQWVISTGLFQISQESASSSRYGCGKMTTAGLKKPEVNIPCSTKIIATWVKADGFAGTSTSSGQKGCARYFSTCRNSSSARAYVTATAKKAPGCM